MKAVQAAESKINKLILRRLRRTELFKATPFKLPITVDNYDSAIKFLESQEEANKVKQLLELKFRRNLENSDYTYVTSPESGYESDEERMIRRAREAGNEESHRLREAEWFMKYIDSKFEKQDKLVLENLAKSKTILEPDILLKLDYHSIVRFVKQHRAYRGAGGQRPSYTFVHEALYSALSARINFDRNYYPTLSTIPDRKLENFLLEYAQPATMTEAIRRLGEVIC